MAFFNRYLSVIERTFHDVFCLSTKTEGQSSRMFLCCVWIHTRKTSYICRCVYLSIQNFMASMTIHHIIFTMIKKKISWTKKYLHRWGSIDSLFLWKNDSIAYTDKVTNIKPPLISEWYTFCLFLFQMVMGPWDYKVIQSHTIANLWNDYIVGWHVGSFYLKTWCPN